MTMRTITKAVEHFKQTDPNTAVTEHMLRIALKTGAIPSVRAGSKYLVAIENIETYLQGDVARKDAT